MVQVLHPVDPLAHKPRTYSTRCTPLTRRRTLPTPRNLTFSQSWHQNAVERAAVRKLTNELASRASPLPNIAHSFSLPAIFTIGSTLGAPVPFISSAVPGISVQAEDNQAEEIPGTPATPLESQEYYPEPESQPESQPEPKTNIFNSSVKSDVLLDLTIAALYRIYIDDYSEAASWNTEPEVQAQPSATLQIPSNWPKQRVSVDYYEQSPPSICGSAASSASSTPSSGIPTPQSFSPAIDPEIAYAHQAIDAGRFFPNKVYTASPAVAAAAGKPVTRMHSAPVYTRPVEAPTLGDKKNLRWFLVELLRRSRSSASVVQLALHYLAQARGPVGDILRRRFKSGTRQDCKDGQGKDEDSPLLDPRRLLLAALMLSTKLLHDHAPNNRAWSSVCGLTTHEVGACERALCKALDWDLASVFVGPRDEQPIIV